jgi:sporulation protein YlmC with PRC-barrel domain
MTGAVKTGDEVDLGLGVLDHQLVDSEGRRCGKVDDLEITGIGDKQPVVEAIVVGVSAWRGRGLVARLAASAARRRRAVLVPWDEVDELASGVVLRHRAHELRLGRGDDRARRFVEWLPKAR